MGQANNRGTFEQRQSTAIQQNQERKEAMARCRAVEEANMTPEQRDRRHKARTFMTIAAGLSAGSGFGMF